MPRVIPRNNVRISRVNKFVRANKPAILQTELIPGDRGPEGPSGAMESPADVGKLPFSTAVENAVEWRFATQDDIHEGFSASFTGGTTIEVGASVTPHCTWHSANGEPLSAVFTDSLDNTIDVLDTTSFDAPTYSSDVPTTIDMQLVVVGPSAKTLHSPVHIEPRSFWGAGPIGVYSQADAEALASSELIGARGQDASGNVGSGQELKTYLPKSIYTTAPSFLFGAIPTDFGVTTVTITRNSVSQDYWACGSASEDTGPTAVKVQ